MIVNDYRTLAKCCGWQSMAANLSTSSWKKAVRAGEEAESGQVWDTLYLKGSKSMRAHALQHAKFLGHSFITFVVVEPEESHLVVEKSHGITRKRTKSEGRRSRGAFLHC